MCKGYLRSCAFFVAALITCSSGALAAESETIRMTFAISNEDSAEIRFVDGYPEAKDVIGEMRQFKVYDLEVKLEFLSDSLVRLNFKEPIKLRVLKNGQEFIVARRFLDLHLQQKEVEALRRLTKHDRSQLFVQNDLSPAGRPVAMGELVERARTEGNFFQLGSREYSLPYLYMFDHFELGTIALRDFQQNQPIEQSYLGAQLARVVDFDGKEWAIVEDGGISTDASKVAALERISIFEPLVPKLLEVHGKIRGIRDRIDLHIHQAADPLALDIALGLLNAKKVIRPNFKTDACDIGLKPQDGSADIVDLNPKK